MNGVKSKSSHPLKPASNLHTHPLSGPEGARGAEGVKTACVPVKLRTSVFSIPHSHRIRRIVEHLVEAESLNDVMFSNPIPQRFELRPVWKREVDDVTSFGAVQKRLVSAVAEIEGKICFAGPEEQVSWLEQALAGLVGKKVSNNKVDLKVIGKPKGAVLDFTMPMPWNVLVVPEKPDSAPTGHDVLPYRVRGKEIDIRICSAGRCSWAPAVYYRKIRYRSTIPTPTGPATNLPLPFEGAKMWLAYLNAARAVAEKVSRGEEAGFSIRSFEAQTNKGRRGRGRHRRGGTK